MNRGIPHFKIKLKTGRVLGPLDLERIRKLILKKHITGVEVARDASNAEWQDINRFPEIAELLVLHAQGKLKERAAEEDAEVVDPYGATRILPQEEPLLSVSPPKEQESKSEIPEANKPRYEVEPTQIVDLPKILPSKRDSDLPIVTAATDDDFSEDSESDLSTNVDRHEKTVVLDRVKLEKQKSAAKRKPIRTLLILVILVLVLQQMQKEDEQKEASQKIDLSPVRAHLPSYVAAKPDPIASQRLYGEAMKYYVQDHVQGYKSAVVLLQKAIGLDTSNVKAIAMLASSYINLMDVSNKDEEYFSIISKLLDNIRGKSLDLAESTIADAEFLMVLSRSVAAEERIVEYTKRNSTKDFVLFYYLALAYYQRGKYESAAHFLSQYPETQAFSPKLFYLRGVVAEALGKKDQALSEYEKALKVRNDHAKSRLRIAQLLDQKGKLGEAGAHLDFLINNRFLLSPQDLAETFYLRSRYLSGIQQNPVLAVPEIEKAVAINRKKHEYLLEYFTVMSQAGRADRSETAKREAKMFYYLGEGERLYLVGKYDEALVQYLSARDANPDSFHPLVKIGEMFLRQNKPREALDNFTLAVKKSPNSVEAWARYAAALIRRYEWEDAEKAIRRLAELNANASMIDRLRGDYYTQQGLVVDAQAYYKQAMTREPVDAEVYRAYADNLMRQKKYKEAPFYYALALRFDPQNFEAFSGTARAVAELDDRKQAMQMLDDEIKRKGFPESELYATLAEIQVKDGELEAAQRSLRSALESDHEFARPYRILGDLFAAQAETSRDARKKALDAYAAYSDRNLSDPSGYLERYKMFLRAGDFKSAIDELDKIDDKSPKYLNLHYYYGVLFSQMKNAKRAAEEFSLELKFNPHNVIAILALGREMVEADPKTALGLFMKAVQLAPQSAEAKFWAGYANAVMKNHSAAIALYRSAISADSNYLQAYKKLALAYAEVGDLSNAKAYAQKYIDMNPDAPDRADVAKLLQ